MDFLNDQGLILLSGPYRGLASQKIIRKGEVIFADVSIAVTPTIYCCSNCLSDCCTISCACSQVGYCSSSCKDSDWIKGHRYLCNKKVDGELILLLKTHVFLGTCDRDFNWKRDAFFNLVYDCRVTDELERIAEAQKLQLPFIGKDSVAYIQRFRRNNFRIHDSELFTIATGVFPYGSLLNHSCIANCVVQFKNTTLLVRSICDILPGQELYISYVDTIKGGKERRKELFERYGFLCDCIKCLQEDNVGLGGGNYQMSIDDTIFDFHRANSHLSPPEYMREQRKLALTIPTIYFDLSEFSKASKLFHQCIHTLNWKEGSKLLSQIMAVYILHYPANHPMLSVFGWLAAKCNWNSGGTLDCRYVDIALSVFEVAYGVDNFPLLHGEICLLSNEIAKYA